MILPELAEKIVNEVKKLIDEDIIVVNTDGNIIASTDRSRIGSFHEGAKIAAMEKRKLEISKEDQQKLKGVKAGINFPIFFQHDVIGIIGITGEPSSVTPFGEIVRKMTELLISENYYYEQYEWKSRAIEALVMDWLRLADWDSSFLDRARLLSIDMSIERIGTIIELHQIGSPLPRSTWAAILGWRGLSKSDVAARWGNDRIILLLDESNYKTRQEVHFKLTQFADFIKSIAGVDVYTGIGPPVTPREISHSYTHAARALKIASPSKPIVFDEDLTLEMLLDGLSSTLKKEFIYRTLGTILHEKELLLTIRELFNQNHAMKQTAATLHIHINTLHYRLKKILDLTGFDLRKTHDMITIYLAILILDEQTNNSHKNH
ncbi:carbohydrate diacid regulator [Bacillus sp. FJAT-27225]|uniref:CdaR family transcriptional regulator n=1 Tax=Bacillus sp. FJAT-27225 TaxID=1743144 RepID=UPI00080C235C|nr:sugar diacid recognition domain-containing protein [Bacillus sp. FJAT-27225]OCA85651.1 carbohydrate diacid regulator [Bacillus sp. FJAT-27225]